MKSTEKDNPNKELIPIEKLTKYVACFTALIAIVSVIGASLIKAISFGRCLYFDFDMDYYEFSLSKSIVYVFVITLVCVLIALIQSVILRIVYYFIKRKLEAKSRAKKIVLKLVASFILIVLEIIITCWLWKLLFPDRQQAVYLATITLLLCFTIYCFIYMIWGEIDKRNIMKIILIIPIISLLIFTLGFAGLEYEKAEEQKEFPIITYNQEHYVVISEGKTRYSAYKCKIEDEVLLIITDQHKYFDIDSTDTVIVEFIDKKPKKQESISPVEFLEKAIEINSTGY